MTLHEWGLFHKTDKATAHKYLDFYESRIGEPKSILEFGVLNGSSLKTWRDRYPGARVVGFDIEPKPKMEGVEIHLADCNHKINTTWLSPMDLILDDASHQTKEQIETFEIWWHKVNEGGHYIIEDCHTMHYTQYNPEKIDFKGWVESLGIKHEYFWRVPGDESDSGTVIFYK